MRFTVMVADNYHYMDESATYELGTFETLEEAIAVSKRIVDDYLTSASRVGMTAQDLFENYMMFGEDPYVVIHSPDENELLTQSSEFGSVPFSARNYAKVKCEQLCSSSSSGS